MEQPDEGVATRLYQLPADALVRVAHHLDARDALTLRAVGSRPLREAASAGEVWRRHWRTRWRGADEVAVDEWAALHTAGDWFAAYLLRCQVWLGLVVVALLLLLLQVVVNLFPRVCVVCVCSPLAPAATAGGPRDRAGSPAAVAAAL